MLTGYADIINNLYFPKQEADAFIPQWGGGGKPLYANHLNCKLTVSSLRERRKTIQTYSPTCRACDVRSAFVSSCGDVRDTGCYRLVCFRGEIEKKAYVTHEGHKLIFKFDCDVTGFGNAILDVRDKNAYVEVKKPSVSISYRQMNHADGNRKIRKSIKLYYNEMTLPMFN